MFFVVLGVLVLTAVIIGLVNFNTAINSYIIQKQFTNLKSFYVMFSIVFIVVTTYVSRLIDGSLLFLMIDEQYSTGFWAALYMAVIYVFAFEDVHLTSMVTSKEKSWRKIQDSVLTEIAVSAGINLLVSQASRSEQFILILEQLKFYQSDSVIYHTSSLNIQNENEFEGICYMAKEERISSFLERMQELINSKT